MRRISALLASGLLALTFSMPAAVAASPGNCSDALYAWNSAQLPSGFWSQGSHTIDWVYGGATFVSGSFVVDADAPVYPGQVTMTLVPTEAGPWAMILLQDSSVVPFGMAGAQVINPAQRTDLMDLYWYPLSADFGPFWVTREDARALWATKSTQVVIDGGTAMELRHSPLMSSCMGGMGWMNVIGSDHGASGAFHRSYGPGGRG